MGTPQARVPVFLAKLEQFQVLYFGRLVDLPCKTPTFGRYKLAQGFSIAALLSSATNSHNGRIYNSSQWYSSILSYWLWKFTPWKFNIAPENGWLEDEFPFGIPYFQGLC